MDAPLESELRIRSRRLRRRLLDLHFKAGAGHIASSLSCLEVLVHIFARRLHSSSDRVMVSKGHAASAVYVTLAEHGWLSESSVQSFGPANNRNTLGLPSHLSWSLPAPILAGSGSLGHGLGIAAGWALGQRIQAPGGEPLPRVACLLSDGELNAGSVWEALLFIRTHRLTNLEIYIDLNGLQGLGRTQEILELGPLATKLESFGFAVHVCDGHDLRASNWSPAAGAPDSPQVFICRTIKGHGISFMQDQLAWHYQTLDAVTYAQAVSELEAQEDSERH